MASNYFIVDGSAGERAEVRRYSDGERVEWFRGPNAMAEANAFIRDLEQKERKEEAAALAESVRTRQEGRSRRFSICWSESLQVTFVSSKTGLVCWFLALMCLLGGAGCLLLGAGLVHGVADPPSSTQRSEEALGLMLGGAMTATWGVALIAAAPSLFLTGLVLHYLKEIAVNSRRTAQASGPQSPS